MNYESERRNRRTRSSGIVQLEASTDRAPINACGWQADLGRRYPNQLSHSGLFDPRGTITVRYDPGDLDR